MQKTTILRSWRDRLRYTLSFEIILMAILVPFGAVFFETSLADIGLLGVILSTKAMVLNFAYNWVFDLMESRAGRISSERSPIGRVLHALGFEVTLTITSLPILMFWLKIGVLQALAADIVVTSFVVIYTFAFTLVYDRAFPLRRNATALA
ncbi:PACE efflux transporter [Antarctobacter jejuensis]|uniref:PACE efflux transporter n=1 Tax=Antarctobacter jejuensis TaxID=1439938 RepID=UPI003FD65880